MRAKHRKKFLLILLWFIILPVIINTPLFSTLNKNINYINHEEFEKDLISEKNIYTSSSTPPNRNYFRYYKQITINCTKVAGTGIHKNFPVLISIFDSELRYVVQSDGDDIAFANDTDWLDHEIELFNQNYNSTHAQLVAWVRVPRLFTSIDTNIFMYYGNYTMENQENPTGVWDNNYIMVHHLHETSGMHYDSTSYNNDGIVSGGITQDTTGKIDGTDTFDGNNDKIQIPESPSLDPSSDITVEAWVNFNELASTRGDIQKIVFKRHNSAPWLSYELMMHIDDNLLFQWLDLSENYKTAGYWRGDIQAGIWYQVVGVRDGNSLLFYLNGVDDYTWNCTVSGPMFNANRELNFGSDSSQYYLNGTIDEVRVSNVARPAGWIKTQYNNQNDPNNFYSISSSFQIIPPLIEDFTYHKIITIDHNKVVGSNYLSNFPLLISIFDSDLRNHAQSDGDDIAFFNGNIWLYHEIETFDKTYNDTHAHLVAWVRIPSLSPFTDTNIMMYYGNSTMEAQENPTRMWDNNYIMVQHLHEKSSSHEDSTINNNDGTEVGGVNQSAIGKIDGADDFDGVDDKIKIPVSSSLNLTGPFSIEMWIKIYNYPESFHTLFSQGRILSGPVDYYRSGPSIVIKNNHYIYFDIYNDTYRDTAILDDVSFNFNEWYHIVCTYDGTDSNNQQIYVNGMKHILTNVGEGDITHPHSINYDFCLGADDDRNSHYFNGSIDEVRVSNAVRSSRWIETEYNNQYDPSSFYTTGAEQITYSQVQVNVFDLYDNPIPNVNISIYNHTKLISSTLANSNGSALFSYLYQAEYNFTVTIKSNIAPFFTEIINRTSEAILIDNVFQNVSLKCNVSRTIFNIRDIDKNPVESGWIIVGNSTNDLQNCTIGNTGYTTFRWLNTSGYNYTIWYRDVKYNPKDIILASGDILMPNSQINLSVNLTTVNFTVYSYPSAEPVSGAKLMLRNYTSGESIVNLTTDQYGKATFRWLNSSGYNGFIFNYSLQIRFYGEPWLFNISDISQDMVYQVNFAIIAKATYHLDIIISLTDYTTELISLNPTDYISIKWGSVLKLRVLFNVTKAGPLTHLVGPTYADTTSYQIYDAVTIVRSGTLFKEEGNIGRHQILIETESLESNKIYFIILKAQKAGFTIPSDLVFTLFTQDNDLILNQSSNEDLVQSVYWLDSVNMSVKPYGKMIESFTVKSHIFCRYF